MADVFVNCTREESLSMINLEVQAFGTPVITYNDTGVQETIDNVCFFSIKFGDFQSLYIKAHEVAHSSSNYRDLCR